MTVTDLLRAGAKILNAATIDGADARSLLAFLLGVPRDRLVLMGPDPVARDIEQRFFDLVEARVAGQPVSKIIGRRVFWAREFIVTADVLDPRPETESLIAAVLEQDAPRRLLDLGTGSGCIALTLLAECPNATAVLCDISAAALQVARRNAKALGVADRATFIQSDWFENVEGAFDLIVSNPPYITDVEMTELSVEVRDHDPHIALTPGGDGLEPYRVIAHHIKDFLSPDGRLLVEIGWQQGSDVSGLFEHAGLENVNVLPDLDGRDRVVTGEVQ